MIYRKDANFPYPILSETSMSYTNYSLDIDIDVFEDDSEYVFKIELTLGSDFLDSLILEEKAYFYLVIQAKDNKIFQLDAYPDVQEKRVKKSRISLSNKTLMQVFLVSNEEVNFAENNELDPFFDSYKGQITIPRNYLLGYSNIVQFDGDLKSPVDLFEKSLDETIHSEIKVECRENVIVLIFRDKEFQLNNHSHHFINPYIYLGLNRALTEFFFNNIEDDELEILDISEMAPPDKELDKKLYQLMRAKAVDELSKDNLDEIIYLISDKPIEKYVLAIQEVEKNGN